MGSWVGLSILWGLASVGGQEDFIESRDTEPSRWQVGSNVEMDGYVIGSLGDNHWLFDTGNESVRVALPVGQSLLAGARLRLRGEPLPALVGWLLQVNDVRTIAI